MNSAMRLPPSCLTVRRGVVAALALLVALPALSACAGPSGPLEPMVLGWEQIFRLEWEVAQRGGRPVVRGYLTNDSPYTVTQVRLLVEALGATGAVTAQEVSWIGADILTPFNRTYFEVRAPVSPAITYRVRVFTFDRREGGPD